MLKRENVATFIETRYKERIPLKVLAEVGAGESCRLSRYECFKEKNDFLIKSSDIGCKNAVQSSVQFVRLEKQLREAENSQKRLQASLEKDEDPTYVLRQIRDELLVGGQKHTLTGFGRVMERQVERGSGIPTLRPVYCSINLIGISIESL